MKSEGEMRRITGVGGWKSGGKHSASVSGEKRNNLYQFG